MASIISAGTTSGTSLNLSGDTSGVLQLATNGSTTAITIDTSQNVGIGTASPSNRLSVVTASGSDGFISVSSPTTETAGVSINGGTSSNKGAIVRFQKNASTKWTMGTDSGIIGGTSDNFHLYGGGADAMLFSTNATERMRIDSNGYVGIGNASPGSVPARLVVSQGGNIAYFQQNAAGGYCGQFDAIVNGGTYYFVNFLKAGVGISNITSNGTTISYNTGSDYRLKDNIEPITNALETVAKLKPSKWNWKEFWGGGSSQGFVAHELAEIIPDCVTGEKDAVETYTDEEGNEQTKPVYQGVDTSFLVATLTAAIQELKAELDATKAEVAALKGVN